MTPDEVRVDPAKIEKQLTELWRAGNRAPGAPSVTKAALWNVVAHTWTSEHHAHAAEVLSRASELVPQRTIVVHADPAGREDMRSAISTNVHVAGGQKVASEEVSIVAAGDAVEHVPPLVSALLVPDMPVALWWLGDWPDDVRYAETLLDPADRLIFDSAQFDSLADLDFVCRIAEHTTTAPADLNWARIEEWRAATAALFDPPAMRERLGTIRNVRVVSGGPESFSADTEALLYVSWLRAQTALEDAEFEREFAADLEAGIGAVEIRFADDSTAKLHGDRGRGVVISNIDGTETKLDCVTRANARREESLIVRLLKRPETDTVYLRTLRVALKLSA